MRYPWHGAQNGPAHNLSQSLSTNAVVIPIWSELAGPAVTVESELRLKIWIWILPPPLHSQQDDNEKLNVSWRLRRKVVVQISIKFSTFGVLNNTKASRIFRWIQSLGHFDKWLNIDCHFLLYGLLGKIGTSQRKEMLQRLDYYSNLNITHILYSHRLLIIIIERIFKIIFKIWK